MGPLRHLVLSQPRCRKPRRLPKLIPEPISALTYPCQPPPRESGSGTQTSAFGSAGRRGHDSTRFYAGRLYEGLPAEKRVDYVENPLPPDVANSIFPQSSTRRMRQLPDCSVHLMVTSPPYNVGKEYDDDLTLGQYRAFLRRAMRQVYRVLVPGGRVCFNIANLGRRPYLPLHRYIIEDLLALGFLMRGEVFGTRGQRRIIYGVGQLEIGG